MAQYTYKCENEEPHFVEHTYGMVENRPEVLECPICGKNSKRVFNSPQVFYRGNGFYSTDNNDHKKNNKPVVENTSI